MSNQKSSYTWHASRLLAIMTSKYGEIIKKLLSQISQTAKRCITENSECISNIIDRCYANKSRNFVNEDAIRSKVQELRNLNSWVIEKTLCQKKNIYFVLISILYRIESRSERIEISELKRDEDEFISKSQEVQRQTHADISNIEQSAKNTEFNKRNRNFSLQEIMRSRNRAFSKNLNRICKNRNSRNNQYALQEIRKNYQKGEKHSDVYRRIANSEKDSRDRNRNWNDSDIHAWTHQIQQSDKRFWQNNHNESETASY